MSDWKAAATNGLTLVCLLAILATCQMNNNNNQTERLRIEAQKGAMK